MEKNFKILCVQLLLVAAGFVTSGLHGQSTKVLSTNAGLMKLSGTSTFHDWFMNGTFAVEGSFKVTEGSNDLLAVNELSFSLPVTNLKSDKKKLDETAYKALKTDQHKEILFSMISATVKEVQSDKFHITATGNLTIAGVTKPITLNVMWVMNDDNSITCTGTQKLKMTDYKVQPPGFLGVMKTGDEIALDFSFQIKA